MSANVLLLVSGLLLLWFPRQWMRLGFVIRRRTRRHVAHEPWKHRERGDPRLSYAEFGKLRNYFDLFRGAAGALAIVGWRGSAAAIFVSDATDRGVANQVLVLKVAILAVGVLIQMIRYERHRLSFFAPIFYLGGVSVALTGPWGALFAFLLVWALNPMFGNAEVFLIVHAILLVGFGILFRDTPRLLVIAAFLLSFLPALVALLMRRPLVVFSRRTAHESER